jgi:quercetin dioxygenase-like cupin family protein
MAMKGKPQQQLEQKNMKALNVTKPIHGSPFRRALLLIGLALVPIAALTAVPAHATPPSPSGPPAAPPYLMTEFILSPLPGNKATFDEIDISAKWDINPSPDITYLWKARIDTKGTSDLYVVRNTFDSGATTGWHTHPGPSLITVTVGTITAYDGDDPTCTSHVYPQGSTFIDAGGGHVHRLRNESGATAVTVAVQLVPAGFARRIDKPNPGYCLGIN